MGNIEKAGRQEGRKAEIATGRQANKTTTKAVAQPVVGLRGAGNIRG